MARDRRSTARLAWAGLGLILALNAAGGILIATRSTEPIRASEIPFLLAFLLFPVIGALILARQPGNRIGALYLAMGLGAALSGLGSGYAEAVPLLPGREWFAWLGQWAWVIGLGGLPFVLLLFPDGHLPSRRWRAVGWLAGLGALSLLLGNMFTPTLVDFPGIANPVGVEAIVGTPLDEGGIGWLLFVVAIPASAAAMVVRFRRARGVERIQLKWLAASAVTVGAAYGFLASAYEGSLSEIAGFVFFASILSVPVVTGIAILKHRLFDIDVVINRALVYGALAAFIGIVYVALVVGVGALLDLPSVGLQIAATAVVAVAFHPLRERLQRVANRLVFGRRASPYEVLSGFSDRVAETYATEDVLPRMARIIGEGTAAARAEVWLRVGDELVRAGTWPTWPAGDARPESAARADRLPLTQGELPTVDADRTVPVRHRNELLGAVAVSKRPGELLSPAETNLLDDLAHQAGLVLRNVRLTAELRARLEELSSRTEQLRESRQRIVETQDAERRRLERNIHDGAQQHLVALAVKLRLARTMATRDPDRARVLVSEARGQTARALETLRDLAGGIYPPTLTERGVAAALAEQIEGLGIAIEVQDGGLGEGRLPAEVEAAVYFSALEALQNAAKHAGARRVVVRLDRGDGDLAFSVSDDGRGFDPAMARRGSGLQNLADRLEALGGTLEVDAAPGAGATIRGRIPVPAGAVAGR
jgi:signal transduction histidine kinase